MSISWREGGVLDAVAFDVGRLLGFGVEGGARIALADALVGGQLRRLDA